MDNYLSTPFECKYCGEIKKYAPMVDGPYVRLLWAEQAAKKSCADCDHALGPNPEQMMKIIRHAAKQIVIGNHNRHFGRC